MNATIAQLVVLTCYGNAALQGRVPFAPVFPDNSACKFCDRVDFVETGRSFFGNPREKRVAATPDDWFDLLKRRHARAIRLQWRPRNDPRIADHQSAGFIGGGGDWALVVAYAHETEFWNSRWAVFDRNAPQQRIWRVTYGPPVRGTGGAGDEAVSDLGLTVLHTALREILAFAQTHDAEGFVPGFREALDGLDGVAVGPAPQPDLYPPGALPRDASALLDAAQRAWVFGGMGSWNDMSFEGDAAAEYARVSRQLYAALVHSICAAANQSAAPTAAASAQLSKA